MSDPTTPNWRATALSTFVSLLFAAGLCAWAARGLSSGEVHSALVAISPVVLAPVLLLFATTFFVVETLGFGTSWRRHVWDQMPWSHVRALVCGKQVLFVALPLLTKTVGPLYFWRRKRGQALVVLGASEMIGGAELIVAAAASFAGAVRLAPVVAIALAVGLALAGVLAWFRKSERLAGVRFVRALRDASAGELWFQLGLRAALQGVALACVWVLLDGMGARLDLGQLLTFGPLFVISGSSIISLAGYGGPQGLAVELLAHRWGLLSAPAALAFSLAWTTGILVTETIVGVLHFPRMVHLLRTSTDG